jgi:hypothetical protein
MLATLGGVGRECGQKRLPEGLDGVSHRPRGCV